MMMRYKYTNFDTLSIISSDINGWFCNTEDKRNLQPLRHFAVVAAVPSPVIRIWKRSSGIKFNEAIIALRA